ncbi:hypothetical protein P879_08423 [Paragonimus westermani]|uniref:Uncharacterized protein n=1 Tax=Paragonimus westermani TaxID=34504 RepID=A0A8T0DID7_9TREM|nr:hypothetical protein P879_08423 [Paragonimus westermani]
MQWTSLEQPIATGLLPTAVLVTFWDCVAGLFRLLVRSGVPKEQQRRSERSSTVSAKTTESVKGVNQPLLDFVSMFLIFQLSFFTLMAALIMRLKLFWTPQLCLTLALLAHPTRWQVLVRQFTTLIGSLCQTARRWSNRAQATRSSAVLVAHTLLILFLAYMTVPGLRNLQAERAIHGQFSAYNDEVLLDWFQSLPPIWTTTVGHSMPWVIAGPMSTLGGLRLMLPSAAPYPTTQWSAPGSQSSAGFAFTNHPHYESAQLRERTVLAYAIYSRRPVHEVWKIYHQQLQANFVIMDAHSCRPRDGCSNPELFDLIDSHLIGQPALCQALMQPQMVHNGLTPSEWKPYFDVVYVDLHTERVVLFVRPS